MNARTCMWKITLPCLSLWQPNCTSLGKRKMLYSVLIFHCSTWLNSPMSQNFHLQRLYWKAHLIMFPCFLFTFYSIQTDRLMNGYDDTYKVANNFVSFIFIRTIHILLGKTYPTMPCYISHEMDIWLTLRSLDKMTTIFQTTFLNAFYRMNTFIFFLIV